MRTFKIQIYNYIKISLKVHPSKYNLNHTCMVQNKVKMKFLKIKYTKLFIELNYKLISIDLKILIYYL